MFRIFLILCLLPSLALAGEDYSEPPRGSDLRSVLLDAVRPHAVWNLGEQIEFVVDDLRVSKDIAYASLTPQHKGGVAIDFWQTPLMKRGEIDPEFYDGVTMIVLYQKSGETWVAVHWSIGSTDVWWAGPEFCAVYKTVTPEFCF